jgi:hypothetical protein
MRLVRSVFTVGLTLLALTSLAWPASAETLSLQPHGKTKIVKITINCVADTVSGEVFVFGATGSSITIRLDQKASDAAPWSPTGKSMTIVLDGRVRYPYSFDVSDLNAAFYQVLGRTAQRRIAKSDAVSADSCQPGPNIPEAGAAILLPGSMLATLVVGGFVLRRRRAARAVA